MDSGVNNQASRTVTRNERSQGSLDAAKCDHPDKDSTTPTSVIESDDQDAPEVIFECPVCLQTASFPVQLPCRHIFCFLCVKGVANRSKRCAMCRQEIPADFFNDPKLLKSEEMTEKSKTIFDEGYQWFYEGRNGWWRYDERTSQELEIKYKAGERMFELLIAGFLYVIDLENMRQFRRNDQTRRRKMKRDMCDIPDIKGIAGLKYNESQQVLRPSGDGGEAKHTSRNVNPITTSSAPSNNQSVAVQPVINNRSPVGGQDDSFVGPSAPNNTPQAPMTPADSQSSSLANSQEDLSLHLQNLHMTHPSVGITRSRPESPNYSYPHHLYDENDPEISDDLRELSGYIREEAVNGYNVPVHAEGDTDDPGEVTSDGEETQSSSPDMVARETCL